MPTTTTTTTTSFIQLCVHFYAILGFPVQQRVRWRDASKYERCTTFLLLVYNLLIGAMVVWSFFLGDAFVNKDYTFVDTEKDNNNNNPESIFTSLASKPLLLMLLKINYYYNYPMSYPIVQGYLLFAGPPLVRQLLKAERLLQASKTQNNVAIISRPKRTFALVVLTLSLLFLSGFYQILLQYDGLFRCCPLAAAANATSLYISLMSSLLPVGVLLYMLTSSVRLLLAILKEVRTEQNDCQASAVKQQIRSLSRVSVAVYRLISLPLSLFLLSSALDTMVTICVVGYVSIYGILAYVLAIIGLLFYVCHLGVRVKQLLRMVTVERCSSKDSLLQIETDDTATSKQQSLQMNELEAVYGDRLQVRLFEVLSLDRRTLLRMFLFLLNYSILIMQTK